jgi:hypothetical protein
MRLANMAVMRGTLSKKASPMEMKSTAPIVTR